MRGRQLGRRTMMRGMWLGVAAVALASSCGARPDLSVDEDEVVIVSGNGAGGASSNGPLTAELRDVEVFINIEGSAVMLISGELVLDNSQGVFARQVDVVAQSVMLLQDDIGQAFGGPPPDVLVEVPAGQVMTVPYASDINVTSFPGIENFCLGGGTTSADVAVRLQVLDEQLIVADDIDPNVECACC